MFEQGFSELNRSIEDNGEHMLHLVMETIPTFDKMNELCKIILTVLEDEKGIFDGWGCPICTAEEN